MPHKAPSSLRSSRSQALAIGTDPSKFVENPAPPPADYCDPVFCMTGTQGQPLNPPTPYTNVRKK